jgi:alpha-D-ribose 1-methylphosphonate 5-triphosphate synthase subunit PhnG
MTALPTFAASGPDARSPRQNWMAILARATASDLEVVISRHGGVPAHVVLKPAEIGTVMIEGRAGGTGMRFNAGETTVTRCVVRLQTGTLGYAMVLGRDRRKALLAATLDGLLQETPTDAELAQEVRNCGECQATARDLVARKAASTQVEFFTLVRGSE